MPIKSADTINQKWLESFFSPSQLEAQAYKIDAPDVAIKLDQNECPWDWPESLKQSVLDELMRMDWNRYPPAFTPDITRLLAEHIGVETDMVLTSNGSDLLISLIFEAMARHLSGKVVVASPSFPLYESHNRYHGRPYECWPLDEQFRYDIKRLPNLPKGSLVMFASPNNPTGGSLAYDTLAALLEAHPDSVFIADEAYYEFADKPYTNLLVKHGNLILLRTFSKTLGAAGVRVGYAIGNPQLIAVLNKIRLPYLLSSFQIAAVRTLLSYPELSAHVSHTVNTVRAERERVRTELLQAAGEAYEVFPSDANFLLVRWPSQSHCDAAYKRLVEGSVLVRNVSRGPQLGGCLRVSIGLPEDNNRMISLITG